MIMVAPGTGVGGGFVLDGKLYHGASGGAGEVGHMQMRTRTAGCAAADAAAAWKRSPRAGRSTPTPRASPPGSRPAGSRGWPRTRCEEPDARILDLAAERGDASAIAVLGRGTYLGAGLTNLIDLLNPEVIVIGGSLRKSDIYYKTALEGARRDAYPQHAADVRIVEAELGDDAPAMGAALVAIGEAGVGPYPVTSPPAPSPCEESGAELEGEQVCSAGARMSASGMPTDARIERGGVFQEVSR